MIELEISKAQLEELIEQEGWLTQANDVLKERLFTMVESPYVSVAEVATAITFVSDNVEPNEVAQLMLGEEE